MSALLVKPTWPAAAEPAVTFSRVRVRVPSVSVIVSPSVEAAVASAAVSIEYVECAAAVRVPSDVPVETAIAPPDATPTEAISDANLQVTRRVEPTYPSASRRAGEQGVAVFSVLVDPSGHPQTVKVQNSSGYDRLDQAAMEAIRHWTFNPAVRESQKVAAWTSVRVKFQLQTAQG